MARDDPDQMPPQPRLRTVERATPAQYLNVDAIAPADRAAYDRQVSHAQQVRARHGLSEKPTQR